MGIEIHDVNGCVDHWGSAGSWVNFSESVLIPQGGEVIRQFIENGYTEDLDALRSELAMVKAPPGDFDSMLGKFRQILKKCDGVILLDSGFAPDDEAVHVPKRET